MPSLSINSPHPAALTVMPDISNRNLALSIRMMAYERAKGELRGLLHTYWPSYHPDGTKVKNGFEEVNQKILDFIEDLDNSLL